CFVLLALLSFPLTAEAFSRGADNPAVTQHRVQAPADGKTQTPNISPQSVPEPPVLLFLGIGIGLFAIYSMTKPFRGQDAGPKHNDAPRTMAKQATIILPIFTADCFCWVF